MQKVIEPSKTKLNALDILNKAQIRCGGEEP